MFDVYNRHQCLSGFQLLIQYEQQPSSTTNVETTIQSSQIHETPYTNYHTQTYHEGPSSYTSIPYMPQMIITSLILNPLNLIPILAYTHNCLLDRQTTVR